MIWSISCGDIVFAHNNCLDFLVATYLVSLDIRFKKSVLLLEFLNACQILSNKNAKTKQKVRQA